MTERNFVKDVDPLNIKKTELKRRRVFAMQRKSELLKQIEELDREIADIQKEEHR